MFSLSRTLLKQKLIIFEGIWFGEEQERDRETAGRLVVFIGWGK